MYETEQISVIEHKALGRIFVLMKYKVTAVLTDKSHGRFMI